MLLSSLGSKELRDVCAGNSRRMERLVLERGLVHELERRLVDPDEYVRDTVCSLFACRAWSQSAQRQVLESSLVDLCVSSGASNGLLQSMLEFSSELVCRIPLSSIVADEHKALYASSLVWERTMTPEQERFLLEDAGLDRVPAVLWFRASRGLALSSPPPRSFVGTTDLASAIWRLALGRIQPGSEVPPFVPFQPVVGEAPERLLEWVTGRNDDPDPDSEPVDDELLLQCAFAADLSSHHHHEVCAALAVLACTGNASNTVVALLPAVILPSLAAGNATALACLIAATRHCKRVARQVLTWWTIAPPTTLWEKGANRERALVHLVSNLASRAPEAIYQIAELDGVVDLLLAHCQSSKALAALTALTACPLVLGRLVACSELTHICRRATASTPTPQEWDLLNAMAFYLSMSEAHKQVLLCRRDLFWERLVCGNGLRFWTNLLVGGGTGFVDPRHVLAVLTMVASSQAGSGSEEAHLEFLANLAYNSDLDQFKQRMLNDLRVVASIQRALACPRTAVTGLRVVANLAKGKPDPAKMNKLRALFPLPVTPTASPASTAVSDMLA